MGLKIKINVSIFFNIMSKKDEIMGANVIKWGMMKSNLRTILLSVVPYIQE